MHMTTTIAQFHILHTPHGFSLRKVNMTLAMSSLIHNNLSKSLRKHTRKEKKKMGIFVSVSFHSLDLKQMHRVFHTINL